MSAMIKVEVESQDEQGRNNSRRNKIIIAVLAIGTLLLGLGLVAVFQEQIFGRDFLEAPDQFKVGDESVVKGSSSSASDAPLHVEPTLVSPGVLQTVRQKVIQHKLPVIIVSVLVVALLIGGITFGVVYQQQLDEEATEQVRRIAEGVEKAILEAKEAEKGAEKGAEVPEVVVPAGMSVKHILIIVVGCFVGAVLVGFLFCWFGRFLCCSTKK